ncbi:hypothetical protein PHMEG_00015461, partial [Phytophthora megakarya]
HDDADMEELSFTEMYAFLVGKTRDQTLNKAVETERETEYSQIMFEEVFTKHPEEFLPPARRKYPALQQEEVELIVKLFLIDVKEGQTDTRRLRARFQEMVRAIYKSRSSLSETLDVLVKSVQVKPAPVVNPCSKRLFPSHDQEDGTEYIEMAEGKPSIYRFLQMLNFRNRRLPVRNAHEVESGTPIGSEDRRKVIWRRPVGADGIRNELPRDRYHVRLLNLSRYVDEAVIDAHIQRQFQGVYHTWQEPTTAGHIPQTDTWDIFFRCNLNSGDQLIFVFLKNETFTVE